MKGRLDGMSASQLWRSHTMEGEGADICVELLLIQ